MANVELRYCPDGMRRRRQQTSVGAEPHADRQPGLSYETALRFDVPEDVSGPVLTTVGADTRTIELDP